MHDSASTAADVTDAMVWPDEGPHKITVFKCQVAPCRCWPGGTSPLSRLAVRCELRRLSTVMRRKRCVGRGMHAALVEENLAYGKSKLVTNFF